MKRAIYVSLMTVFGGCAMHGPRDMNQLRVGMTKQEVIQTMGTPFSTSAQGPTEFMRYRVLTDAPYARYRPRDEYFVKLIGGKVDSYGRLGDFNSTKDPTVSVNENIHATVTHHEGGGQ